MDQLDVFYDILNNKRPEKTLFIPRFDLWFNVNSFKNPFPRILEGISSPAELSRKMGFLPYSNIPDFTGGQDPLKTVHRSLGFYSIDEAPYRIKFNNTKVRQIIKKDAVYVEYITPVGSVDTQFIFTRKMRESGASISWIQKRLIEKKQDYKVLEYLFEDMEIEECSKAFKEHIKAQGNDFIPIAFGLLASSGMQHIMRDFLEVTDFFIHFMDLRTSMERLAEKIDIKLLEIAQCLSLSPAPLVLIGANFDSTITYAPFYRDYIMPIFQDIIKILKSKGKKIISHCDGENIELWDLYIETGIDILEAAAVFPMVRQPLQEIIKKVDNRAIIWGLINSIALLHESTSEDDFKNYIAEVTQAARKNQVILGISDTAPPDMDINRLLYIKDYLNK